MSILRRLGAWLLGRRASAAWVSDSLLLVAGRPGRDRGCELRAQAQAGGTELRLYACPDPPRRCARRSLPLEDAGRQSVVRPAAPTAAGR